MFAITAGKGFRLTFANGWTVSVQFGRENYCHRRHNPSNAPNEHGFLQSQDAEIAAWDADENWHDFGSDTVKGWVSADDVALFIAEIAAKPGRTDFRRIK